MEPLCLWGCWHFTQQQLKQQTGSNSSWLCTNLKQNQCQSSYSCKKEGASEAQRATGEQHHATPPPRIQSQANWAESTGRPWRWNTQLCHSSVSLVSFLSLSFFIWKWRVGRVNMQRGLTCCWHYKCFNLCPFFNDNTRCVSGAVLDDRNIQTNCCPAFELTKVSKCS